MGKHEQIGVVSDAKVAEMLAKARAIMNCPGGDWITPLVERLQKEAAVRGL